ncbi:MAG: alpha/beta hydrolase [Saprospiraceae bacterium]|nr:alpha/beta hydrolase [Saprospiraceae bacterium]
MMHCKSGLIGVFILVTLSLNAQIKVQESTPIAIGENLRIDSKIMAESRQINIYLPPEFKKEEAKNYGVVYLLDGGLDEDFIHTSGLVQYVTFPWIQQLPPVIVVGIANTDRKRDMTFPTSQAYEKKNFPSSGGATRFIEFIEKEVVALVRNRYQVAGPSYLIGQSLAGLLATEVVMTRPSLFDNYIIVSPSVWWDNGSILKREALELNQVKANIYLAVGQEGLAPCEEPHVMEVDVNLLAEKIKANKPQDTRFYFDYLPSENHATIGHQAVYNAIRWLASKP